MMGALEDKISSKKKKRPHGEVHIQPERCKGCAFCVEFCPRNVLALSSGFNSKGYHPPTVVNLKECTGCDLCGMICPDFAIYGVLPKNSNK
jgi:2-oxoglutarate ferredoxin oxidoreductase subunit delta